MAFKQSWSHVKRAAEPSSFVGKYSLRRIAGMDKKGTECFIIPLDMAEGYSVLPYHSLKKNDSEGFHGSSFSSVGIACKRFDPETGEPTKELPLCCKLAQMEKDRLPEKDDSTKRAISFSSMKFVFPVLVLSTTETDPSKKPTMKKLSIKNGVSFSYISLSESSYDESIKKVVIDALVEAGEIEDPESTDPQELMDAVSKYISHSIIKVSNEASKSSMIPYQKSFRVIPTTNALIGQTSGETKLIQALCKLLTGAYPPESLSKLYTKAPILKEINNQVIDFLALYNDNVDSLVEQWDDEELQKYYNDYVARQAQIEKYKEVNEAAVEAEEEEDEEVSFASSLDDVENDSDLDNFEVDEIEEVEEDEAPKGVINDDDTDFEDLSDVDEVDEVPVKKVAKKPTKVAATVGASDDFDLGDLDDVSSSSSGVDADALTEDDFAMGEDDFEDLV